MPVPQTTITKQDFQTGAIPPSPTGVLAIIAASSTGTQNVATGYARDDLMTNDLGYGPLIEYGSYCLQVGKNPVVAVKPATSIAATYGAITSTPGTGTSVLATDGIQLPNDEFNQVLLTIVAGGTVGTPGITYTYSLDNGNTTKGPFALGAATSATLGNSGVKVNFGAGTLIAGATFSFVTTRPQPNNADLTAALEALRIARTPWEGVLIDCAYSAGTVGQIDTWLSGLEAAGQFHFAIINTRHKALPVPSAESETNFTAAMQALTGTDSSIRVCVGTDAADYTSTLSGALQPRPVAMFLAARAMLIPVGEDPAYVGRGAILGAKISDTKGNPKWHDEDLYPNLDPLRLVTFRSFSPGGPQGVYICNANVISPSGSDYVWLQHVRVMNLACGIAWQILTGQLSVGVQKKPADPVTGQIYIAEQDAQRLEGMVQSAFATPMKGQVTKVTFTLARNDDLSSNSSSKVNGTIQIQSLAYIKKWAITSSFVKNIAVSV